MSWLYYTRPTLKSPSFLPSQKPPQFPPFHSVVGAFAEIPSRLSYIPFGCSSSTHYVWVKILIIQHVGHVKSICLSRYSLISFPCLIDKIHWFSSWRNPELASKSVCHAVCHAECQEGCHERKDGKERAGRKDRKKRKEKKGKKQIKDKRWKRNIRETAKTTPARCQAWLRKH